MQNAETVTITRKHWRRVKAQKNATKRAREALYLAIEDSRERQMNLDAVAAMALQLAEQLRLAGKVPVLAESALDARYVRYVADRIRSAGDAARFCESY